MNAHGEKRHEGLDARLQELRPKGWTKHMGRSPSVPFPCDSSFDSSLLHASAPQTARSRTDLICLIPPSPPSHFDRCLCPRCLLPRQQLREAPCSAMQGTVPQKFLLATHMSCISFHMPDSASLSCAGNPEPCKCIYYVFDD